MPHAGPTGHLETADFVVIGAYCLVMLAVGAYCYKFARGTKDFFSGGNAIPWWLAGVSFYMASFSTFAFVSFSAITYTHGWVGITIMWLPAAATAISVSLFAARWRRARVNSPVEYLEARYSRTIRQLFAWEGLPVRIIDDALKLAATAAFVSASLRASPQTCVLVIGAVAVTYTLLGGLWALTLIGFVQCVVMFAAVVTLLPLAISAAGGIPAAFQNLPQGPFRLTAPKFDAVYMAYYLVLITLTFSSLNWSLVQRYYCVPTERDSLKVGWLVVVLFLVGGPMIVLPALVAPHFVHIPPSDDKTVYAVICLKLLSPGSMGLVFSALFAATLSAISADYNACAAAITNDIYSRWIRPKASQKELLLVGRLSTLLVGGLSLLVALSLLPKTGDGLFKTMMTVFSVFTPPVALPMLLGLTWRRPSNVAAIGGFAMGVITGVVLFFTLPSEFQALGWTWQRETVLFAATFAATLVGLLSLTALLPSRTPRAAELMDRLVTPIGQIAGDPTSSRSGRPSGFSPLLVVGVTVAFIGAMLLIILPVARGKIIFGTELGMSMLLIVLGLAAAWAGRLRAGVAEGEDS